MSYVTQYLHIIHLHTSCYISYHILSYHIIHAYNTYNSYRDWIHVSQIYTFLVQAQNGSCALPSACAVPARRRVPGSPAALGEARREAADTPGFNGA